MIEQAVAVVWVAFIVAKGMLMSGAIAFEVAKPPKKGA